MNDHIKMKDYKYLYNIDRSSESDSMRREMISTAIIIGLLPSFVAICIGVVIQNADQIDASGHVITIVIGLPVMVWSILRTFKNFINP